MSIKLELGKTYLTRDGHQVTIVEPTTGKTEYKWWGSNNHSYKDDGRYLGCISDSLDLIAEANVDTATSVTTSGVNDGGPAFPQRDQLGEMVVVHGGMTLRDYFAAKAMQGMLNDEARWDWEDLAKDAYKMADAMLRARGES